MSLVSERLRAPTALPVLALCALLLTGYGAFIALASPAAFPDRMTTASRLPYLSDKPVGEDGFYMLTVAWHLAEGHGLVYNFGLPTTGVQPLSTMLYGGVAWLVQQTGGDRWTLLRVVQLLGVVNLLLLAFAVGDIARTAFHDRATRWTAFTVAASFTAFNFWLYRAVTYGLETGLYLLLLAACVAFSIRTLPRMTTRSALLLGLLAGATGLARIDFGVVLFGFLGTCLLNRHLRLRHALIVGGTALAVVLPWFAWVYRITGSWLPSSGGAQASFISARSGLFRLREGAEALLNHLTPWLYTGSRGVLALVALATLIVLLVLLKLRPGDPWRRTTEGWRRAMVPWGTAFALLCVVYLLFFGVVHFYERYLSPSLLVLLPLLAVAIAQRVPGGQARWVAALPVFMLVCFGGWAGLSLHTGRVGNTHAVTAGFVQERFAPPCRVGAFQSGVIGYFNPNVLNLDGKLNQEALEAQRQGYLDAYVDSVGIDIIVDWPGHIQFSFPQAFFEGWDLCDARPENGITACITRSSTR